jgi:hypothetical protein
MKYYGVTKTKNWGRRIYKAKTMVNGVEYLFGSFDDPKKAAKAYDMGVLRLGLDKPTNYIKKINLENKN